MQDHTETARRRLGERATAPDAGARRVLERFHRREAISRDTGVDYAARQDLGARMADRVAAFGGSWAFIGLFGIALLAWCGLNLFLGRDGFDPYPFIFLNLILSMLAAFQAPIIMMSQNRQADKDRLAASHDYEVNLKAEFEIMALHDKLDALRADQLAQLIARQDMQIRLLTEALERLQPGPDPRPAD